MAEFNPELPVNLGGSEDYDPGVTKNISVGMTENGRGIMTKKFDQDHILTKIEFDVRGGKFLSAALPAVIRVYQFGFKSDARFLTLTGTGNFSTKISLEITNRETTRQVIVDAWAPNN